MYKYDVNYRKLVLLLLPLRLRKPLISALIYSAVQPLRDLNIRFRSLRVDSEYSLSHNGQVCHLRAAINDVFDADDRRITITDAESVAASGGVVVSLREDEEALVAPLREDSTPIIVHRRGYVVAAGADFWVNVPAELRDSLDTVKLAALISKYKLVSKRYSLNYI